MFVLIVVRLVTSEFGIMLKRVRHVYRRGTWRGRKLPPRGVFANRSGRWYDERGRLVSVGDVSYWRDEHQRLRYKIVDDELVKELAWSGSRESGERPSLV